MKRLALALLLVGSGLLVAVPAEGENAAYLRAHNRPLMLSIDGTHWSARLAQPLFGPDEVLVPGEALTASFLARNLGDDKGRLVLRVKLDNPGAWFRKELVQLRVKLANRSWRRVLTSGRVARVILPEGATVPVAVRVSLARRAGNGTMGRSLTFESRLRLTQVASPRRP